LYARIIREVVRECIDEAYRFAERPTPKFYRVRDWAFKHTQEELAWILTKSKLPVTAKHISQFECGNVHDIDHRLTVFRMKWVADYLHVKLLDYRAAVRRQIWKRRFLKKKKK
jgi:hypothetical protein